MPNEGLQTPTEYLATVAALRDAILDAIPKRPEILSLDWEDVKGRAWFGAHLFPTDAQGRSALREAKRLWRARES